MGLQETLKPEDTLIGIAHYLPVDYRCFKMGREGDEHPKRKSIQVFFYEQKPNFDILEGLAFKQGTTPWCDELTGAISNLYSSGLIVVASHLPWHYHFSKSCDSSFDRFVSSRITPKQDLELRHLAETFNEEVAVKAEFSC